MEKKLKTDKYNTVASFAEDMHLIINNCKSYNPETTIYYKNAEKMEELFNEAMAKRLKKS
jgi:histone acetyltransferase